MPLELEPADVEGEFVVAAAPDVLEDRVDELEELEPHAATPSAANSSRMAAKRLGDLLMVEFMDCSSVRSRRIVAGRVRWLVDTRGQRAVARWTGLYI
jgi:hypothetical protein